MFLLLYLTERMSSRKRVPRQCSHVSSTSARNCISTVTVPLPWQVSQRPPGTLKEKWDELKPLVFAPFVPAKSSRMASYDLIYVTGFERGVRPIGDWSTMTISSI